MGRRYSDIFLAKYNRLQKEIDDFLDREVIPSDEERINAYDIREAARRFRLILQKYMSYSDQYIQDKFIEVHIGLNYLDIPVQVTIPDWDTYSVALTSGPNGKLFDYVEFYNDEFLKRVSVPIETLNPVYQKICRQYLLEKTKNKVL